jgi:ABC-type branched-subunit amino acid transport system substrate-binding protein
MHKRSGNLLVSLVTATCLLSFLGAVGIGFDSGMLCVGAKDKVAVAPEATSSNETQGITDKEILIGSCSALEGPVAGLGKAMTSGAKLYLQHINEQGGVHGRQLKLVCYDDSYDPDKAIQCFNCLQKDKVFCGAFFVGAPPATKYVPMAEANNFPIVGLFTGVPFLHDPFRPHLFNIRNGYAEEAQLQVQHLWKDLGIRKIGVIYQDDACGVATLEGAKKALAKLGGNIVAQGSFARGSLDVKNAVDMVKSAGAEAVIMDGGYSSIVKVVQESHAGGWHPLFVCVSFVAAEPYIREAKADAEGTVITQVVPSYDRTELPTVALYRKLLGSDAKPSFAQFEGFVDAMVLCEALKRAGQDLTRAKLISALESMHNLDIGLGPDFKLLFSGQRHKGFDGLACTVVRNGKPETFHDWKELKK